MALNANNIKVEIGKIPKKKSKNIIYFATFKDMQKVLNPNRMQLLEVIKQHHPESIYELASITKRDQGNVTKDINILKKHGFVNIKQTKQGKRTKSEPKIESEAIEMVIKLGAGLYGLAKDTIEEVSGEFKGKNLSNNKKYIRNKYKDIIKPVKKTVKKIVKEFDIVTKDE